MQNDCQQILCAVAKEKTKRDGIIDLFYDMILTGISETKTSRVTIGLMRNVSI